MANCAIKGEDADLLDFTLATGIGVASGLIGGSGANGAKLRGVANRSKQILETAVSPKKIAMYATKLRNVVKTVVVGTARTISAGFTSNYLNNKRKAITYSIS